MFNWLRKSATVAPPGAVTREVVEGRSRVQLDLSPQVLSLEIPEERTLEEGEETLVPHARDVSEGFISASMLAVKAKVFDDGLYAAAELAAQHNKQPLLASLVHVAPAIAAAARLGGMDAQLSPRAQEITEEFLRHPLASKPIGFYTWSDALRRIFQQDRLLQQELAPAEAAALTAALDAMPAAKAAYAGYLDFVARLTNPLVSSKPDLRQPGGAWFFPPSRSHEAELIERLYGDQPIPDGFSLADEMVRRLRDGSLSLDPTDASGWYDFQAWALQPLVVPDKTPEAARLIMNDRYRAQLEELFKSVLSLTRETHVKQLDVSDTGCRDPVYIEPELSLEPVRTYYKRRALGYDFVQRVLESTGDAVAPLKAMRRLTPAGPVTRPLGEEIAEMAALFRGAAAVAGYELGMEAATGSEVSRFREWAATPDAGEDVRMMVPVFFDRKRRQTKIWAILGWATRNLRVSFATPPTVHVLRGHAQLEFGSAFKSIAYPVFAEAYVTRLLDRDEFRAHCDRYKTRTRILEHLS